MKMDELFEFATVERAGELQGELSARIISVEDSGFNPRLFCGIDVSYDTEAAYVTAAVWDLEKREIVERIESKEKALVAYFPGLLGFREGPLAVSISRKLRSKPDVFLIDGQGWAHPRRFGLACHFGVAVDRPTVGVAKSLLYGRIVDGKILDSERKVIGRVITSPTCKNFYVSVGHRISLNAACRVVEATFVDGHPAPLRQAHLDSIRLKKENSFR